MSQQTNSGFNAPGFSVGADDPFKTACFSARPPSRPGGTFERIGGDSYDCSIEFYSVGNDDRLSVEQQGVIRGAGFARAYLNHNAGWREGDRPYRRADQYEHG